MVTKHFSMIDDPELLADPWGTLSRLREDARCVLTDIPKRAWVLTRYEDVHGAFQQPGVFSSERVTTYFEPDEDIPSFREMIGRLIPIELDPPEHTTFRHLFNPLFSPGRIKEFEPVITEECVSLVDSLVERERCDFAHEFARQFPGRVFMRLFGLPVREANTFLEWTDQLMHTLPEQDPDGAIRAGAGLTVFTYLTELLESRRLEPSDDILSLLIGCQLDGRSLTPVELVQIAFLLYMAGLDTVAGTLGYIFRHLAEHPAQRAELVEHPEQVPDAVEEFLRNYGIVTTGRIVTRDVEFAGCPMRKGDIVLLSTPATGHDPREFPDANKFLMDRKPNRHLAFGAGPHRCLGSHLARAELRIAINQWHRRIPNYHIADPDTVTQHVAGVAGLDALPLAWGASDTRPAR